MHFNSKQQLKEFAKNFEANGDATCRADAWLSGMALVWTEEGRRRRITGDHARRTAELIQPFVKKKWRLLQIWLEVTSWSGVYGKSLRKEEVKARLELDWALEAERRWLGLGKRGRPSKSVVVGEPKELAPSSGAQHRLNGQLAGLVSN